MHCKHKYCLYTARIILYTLIFSYTPHNKHDSSPQTLQLGICFLGWGWQTHTVGGHLSEHVGTGGYSDNWNVWITEAWQKPILLLTHTELLTCCCHRVRCISWLYGSASELLDIAYVASARMCTTVSCCSISISCGKLAVPVAEFDSCSHLCCEAYVPCP